MATALLTLEAVAAACGGLLTGPRRAPLLGVSIDSRSVAQGELFVAIQGPRFDGHDFVAEAARRGAAAAVVHREVEAGGLPLVRVPDTTRALQDLGRHARLAHDLPVVCITGSAGKTTTKEMTAALLAARGPVLATAGNLNNQYGLPLTLLRLTPEHRFAVLEVGMSAPGELRLLSSIARPDIAVITLVAPVHLEFFASVDAIADAKAELLEGLREGGVAALNHDDERVRRIGERCGREVVWFGKDRSCHVGAERWRGTIHGMRFDLRVGGRTVDVALPLCGAHVVNSFLAAAAVADRLGASADAMAEAALAMRPARHRGEVLRLGEGVTLLDDCYNSNPLAVAAAVCALDLAAPGRRVAFLGDMLELGPAAAELHREAGRDAARRLDVLVGVGPLARHLVDGASGATATHHFDDAAGAVAALPELVRGGDAVLVKGSRGIKLEAVVDALIARLGRVEA
jgi:UDP-N-acetylmuramoyl-tripeptide--D-alanyl-D-alanine ligase